jgi:hypothetical protein
MKAMACALVLIAPLLTAAGPPLPNPAEAQAFLECRGEWDGNTVPKFMIDEVRRGKKVELVELQLPPALTVFGLPVHSAYAWVYPADNFWEPAADFSRVTTLDAPAGLVAYHIIQTFGIDPANVVEEHHGAKFTIRPLTGKAGPFATIVVNEADAGRSTITCGDDGGS